MKTYLYTWNPKKSDWLNFKEVVDETKAGHQPQKNWSCGRSKKPGLGDRFYFLRLGPIPLYEKGIIGYGLISSSAFEVPHWDPQKRQAGRVTLSTTITFDKLNIQPIWTLERLQDEFPSFKWTPESSGTSIKDQAILDFLESTVFVNEKFY